MTNLGGCKYHSSVGGRNRGELNVGRSFEFHRKEEKKVVIGGSGTRGWVYIISLQSLRVVGAYISNL